jgi:leader peptidase (prepilin peptidase)/N-methyltransferase
MFITSICLIITAIVTLLTLAIIDLRTWLLPNWLNIILALTGMFFHISISFSLFEPIQLLYGSLLGGGTLLMIRFIGNWYYKQDTLGLGDVKLLAAAGLWLGAEGVVIAITLGALMGTMHGVGVATFRAISEKSPFTLKRLMIPAGPGFCAGILLSGIWKLHPIFQAY